MVIYGYLRIMERNMETAGHKETKRKLITSGPHQGMNGSQKLKY